MMMEHSLWAPVFLGEGTKVIAGLICVSMPETLKVQLQDNDHLSSSVNRDEEREGAEGGLLEEEKKALIGQTQVFTEDSEKPQAGF